MRKPHLISLVIAALPVLILLAAPGLQAPLAAHVTQPVKPIKVWSGVVSWYGQEFQGRKTASGQPFDMWAATAAHPSLPFGSLVRLVNVKTGHSQLVRINDRGPFTDDREMDVSFLVASRLGMLDRGTAHVRIELLEEPKRP